MSKTALHIALAIGLSAFAPPVWAAPSPAVVKAVADPARPDADKARDADRKPDAMLDFAKVRAGERVVDLMPGGGYFTRLFSKAVGPRGTVYSFIPQTFAEKNPKGAASAQALAAEPGYANVQVKVQPLDTIAPPNSLDLVWTSQNYHDLVGYLGAEATAASNKAIFAALKPGGYYVILDHAAAPGSGTRDVSTLHRIDPEAVKADLKAAGFILDGESTLLRNPADTHELKVFDPSLRGHTDQFVLRFKKP